MLSRQASLKQQQETLKGLKQQATSRKKIHYSPEDKVIINYFDTVKSLYAEIDALYILDRGIRQEIGRIHDEYYPKSSTKKSQVASGGGGHVFNQRQIRENRQKLVSTYNDLNSIFSLTPIQSIEKKNTTFTDDEIRFIPILCRRLWLEYVFPGDAVFLLDAMNILRGRKMLCGIEYKNPKFNNTLQETFDAHRQELEDSYKQSQQDRRCVFIWVIPRVITRGISFFRDTVIVNKHTQASAGGGIGASRSTTDVSLSIEFHPITGGTRQLLSKSRSADDLFLLYCFKVFMKIIKKISTDQFLMDLRTTRQSNAILQTLITNPDNFLDPRFADALDPSLLALFVKRDVSLSIITKDKFRQYSRKS